MSVGWEQILIAIIVFAAGGIGARRVVKQDNAWEKIVQAQSMTISDLKGQIKQLQGELEGVRRELQEEHDELVITKTRLEAVEAELSKVEKRSGFYDDPDNVKEFRRKQADGE